ncbi:MAG: hypothetical protein HY080_05645 [Gammaproteobacteria bacterium]|nr:hypothetical protein [Gammaproteobacteria bacterium]
MKFLKNTPVFVILYILFMLPTYYLPYIGSNSVTDEFLKAAAESGVDTLSFLPQLSFLGQAFWLHLGALFVLVLIAWFRGAFVDRKWLHIFPILAATFDLIPRLSVFPVVPTMMHLLTIVLGVMVAKFAVASTQSTT